MCPCNFLATKHQKISIFRHTKCTDLTEVPCHPKIRILPSKSMVQGLQHVDCCSNGLVFARILQNIIAPVSNPLKIHKFQHSFSQYQQVPSKASSCVPISLLESLPSCNLKAGADIEQYRVATPCLSKPSIFNAYKNLWIKVHRQV